MQNNLTVHPDPGRTPVHLGFTGVFRVQRHHSTGLVPAQPCLPFPNPAAYRRLGSGKFMLLHQTLPHPVRGVALLDWLVPVRLEPGIYDPGDRVHHRTGWLLLSPILGLLSGQYFPDRPSRVPGLPGDLSNAFLVNPMCSSDQLVLIHPYQSSPPTRVPVHPVHASGEAIRGGSLLRYRNQYSSGSFSNSLFGTISTAPAPFLRS